MRLDKIRVSNYDLELTRLEQPFYFRIEGTAEVQKGITCLSEQFNCRPVAPGLDERSGLGSVSLPVHGCFVSVGRDEQSGTAKQPGYLIDRGEAGSFARLPADRFL